MRVLVTGGAGYIGSVTTEVLLDHGHEVTVFDSMERGHAKAVDRRACLVKGDLRDKSRILAAMEKMRPDAVMHFAAYALVGESMENPELYWQNNVVGGINLVEAACKAGVGKFVLSSTCATYGKKERMPLTEDDPLLPANPYGQSKLMMEQVLSWQEKIREIKPVFLRYFNACGATDLLGEDHDPETHLIPIVLKVALGKSGNITIHGDDYDTPDGTCIRDYVHVVDIAQAHMLALADDHHGGVFNLGNGEGYSVRQVIEISREVTGHPLPCSVGPRRAGDPARLVASADKARRILGWKPEKTDLATMIRSAWKWHQSHPEGYGD